MFDEFGINAGYVEELHTRWLQSPQSVERGLARFFEGAERHAPVAAPAVPAAEDERQRRTATAPAAYREAVRETVIAATELQSRVAQLVNAYRVRGHLFARPRPARERARGRTPSSSSRTSA